MLEGRHFGDYAGEALLGGAFFDEQDGIDRHQGRVCPNKGGCGGRVCMLPRDDPGKRYGPVPPACHKRTLGPKQMRHLDGPALARQGLRVDDDVAGRIVSEDDGGQDGVGICGGDFHRV